MGSDLVVRDGALADLLPFGSRFADLADEQKRREAALRAEFKTRKLDLQAAFSVAVRAALAELPEEQADVLCAALYWGLTDVPASWLSQAFGISSHAVLERAKAFPQPIGEPCAACGRRETVSSRSDLALAIEFERPRWTQGICPECWPSCLYCHRPLGNSQTKEWYLAVIREGTDAWHTACEPKPRAPATRKQQYADYLQSDHWRSVREWALERAEHRCQVCNTSNRVLHVHHRTYDRVGRELPADLIALCDECHDVFHREGKLA